MIRRDIEPEYRSEGTSPKMTQDFLRLYSLHQRRIYSFIGSFFRAPHDRDEVLQETCIVLWEKFAELRHSDDFLRWAFKVARLEIFRHYRKLNRRLSLLPLDEAAFELLVSERIELSPLYYDAMESALEGCLEKLRPNDQKLIKDCYKKDVMIKIVAAQMNRPINAVYQSLSRIRRTLHECITRTLKSNDEVK